MESLTCVTSGMTVWEARDDDLETNRKAWYRGREYKVDTPGVILEIVTDESWVENILVRIAEAHNIEIVPIEASFHVRSGFMDT